MSRPLRRLARAIGSIALLCVLVWSGTVGYLWLNESRLVFRSQFSRGAGRVLDPAFTPVRLRTTDGVTLDAVALEAATSNMPRYWIVYFLGNAGSLRRPRVQAHLQQLYGLGYNVLSLDYRGYGRSEGTPTESGLYEDGLTAYRHLVTAGVDPSRIILAGQSLGSAVAVEVATRVRAAGLALFSPIDSVPLTAGRIYRWLPADILATNRFDSSAKIARIRQPVIVFHSTNDRLIPLRAVRDLYTKITAAKWMVETAGGHNGAGFADDDALRDAFWRFWPAGAAAIDALAAGS